MQSAVVRPSERRAANEWSPPLHRVQRDRPATGQDRADLVGCAEGVELALGHEHGAAHAAQLLGPAPLRPAGRMQGKPERHDGGRSRVGGDPARHPRTAALAAEHERDAPPVAPQVVDHLPSDVVEPVGGIGRTASGDPVGLVEADDDDPGGDQSLGHRDEHRGGRAPTGAVHQQRERRAARAGDGREPGVPARGPQRTDPFTHGAYLSRFAGPAAG